MSSAASNTSKNPSSSMYELTPVQATSLAVAYYRDLETRFSPEPLFKDAPAKTLLDAFLSPDKKEEFNNRWKARPHTTENMAVRTKAFDEWLLDPSKRSNQQFVNLGAGMCCRPYRLEALKQCKSKVWEVDSDLELLKKKRLALQEAGYEAHLPIVDAAADLGTPSADLTDKLKSTGFQTETPTDWLAEGLLNYLTREQRFNLVEETAALSAPKSRLALTYADPDMAKFMQSFDSKPPPHREYEDIQGLLDKARAVGWVVDKHITPDDWDQMYAGRGQKVPGYHMLFLKKE